MKKIRKTTKVFDATKVGYSEIHIAVHNGLNKSFPITDRGRELVQQAQSCWNAFYEIRERRRRSRRYYRGDQWSDKVVVNGVVMTEEQYIESQGRPALKQNLIRPPVRNIIGQYRMNPYKSIIYPRNKKDRKAAEMMSVAYESAYEMNDGKERDARMMEEFLVSGFPIYDTSFSWDVKRQRSIPKFRKVEVDRFFCTPHVNDVCGDDVDIVGELCDIPLDEAVSVYAKNEFEEKELREIFGNKRPTYTDQRALTADNIESISFYTPAANDTVRIIKVCVLEGRWVLDTHDYLDGTRKVYDFCKKDELDAENEERRALGIEQGINVPKIKYRRKFVRQWVYYHLTPQGHVLFRKENPYQHKDHPYVFKMYPLLDGEVWSLVEDLIDQQRAINRMFILQDFVIGASAKGVLLVPEEAIPDDMDIEDFADEWQRYNGVIKIKTKNGIQMPKQVMASNFNVGINDAINYQTKWLQDIGGVHDAAMGMRPTSGTSASRYKLETMNSNLNALDYIESFGYMLIKRDWKIVQLIKQYYTDKQYIALAGDEYSEEAKEYDPDRIKDLDFDNTMAKLDDNITMRFVSEDSLSKLLEMGLINLKQYLKSSETAYSDKLLKAIEEEEEKAAQGQIDPAQLSQLMQSVQQATPQSSPQGLANTRGLFNGTVI